LGCLLLGVIPVPPGKTRLDLAKSRIDGSRALRLSTVARRHHYLSDSSPIAVCLVSNDIDLLAEHEVRQMLLGSLAEGLLLLRGVDPCHPNLVLLVAPIEYHDCVAIGDADDFA
jgi:hypothetical protein